MKGTMDATLPDARKRLLADPKEAAEHATITDLIRNDLSRFATEVTVTRYRYLDELHTHRGPLLQMSSEIRGRLPEDYPSQLGDLFSVSCRQVPLLELPSPVPCRLSARPRRTTVVFTPA